MIRPLVIALALAAALYASPAPAQPRAVDSSLVTDLSSHLIAVTSSFTGAEILVWGATEESGDIVVVVRGPAAPATVRRKSRILGIWVNRKAIRFENVPSFYAVSASRSLEEIAGAAQLTRLQIGAQFLRFSVGGYRDEEEITPFREAVVRNKIRDGLYIEETGGVAFLGPKLFRTRVAFPANVPIGTYQVEVYLMRDQRAIAAQAMPLFIDKHGIEQDVFEFSRAQPFLYGLTAVAAAALAGWAAAAYFRRA